jgi:hypothetical protein
MNVKRKQAAVNKYSPMFSQGVTVEELGNLLAQDEKQYTAEEINEIRASIVDGQTERATEKQPVKQPGKTPVKVKEVTGVGYEEWRCEIKLTVIDGKVTKREAEKVKKLRPCVKITDEEAETLNYGALHTPRQDFVLMYFKPE